MNWFVYSLGDGPANRDAVMLEIYFLKRISHEKILSCAGGNSIHGR